MNDIELELVHGVQELSVGRFAGMHSEPEEHFIPQIIPRGSYVLDGNTLSGAASGVLPQQIGATVRLHATNAGGRLGATPQGKWRCSIKVGEQHIDCQMYLGNERSLLPGDSAPVRIKLLDPSRISLLPLGTEFELWENKVVGTGHVSVLL